MDVVALHGDEAGSCCVELVRWVLLVVLVGGLSYGVMVRGVRLIGFRAGIVVLVGCMVV